MLLAISLLFTVQTTRGIPSSADVGYRMPLAVVMAELQEVAKDIAVASFQLFEDCALWFLLITKQGCTTTVIADTGQSKLSAPYLRNMAQFFRRSLLRMESASFFGDRIA